MKKLFQKPWITTTMRGPWYTHTTKRLMTNPSRITCGGDNKIVYNHNNITWLYLMEIVWKDEDISVFGAIKYWWRPNPLIRSFKVVSNYCKMYATLRPHIILYFWKRGLTKGVSHYLHSAVINTSNERTAADMLHKDKVLAIFSVTGIKPTNPSELK